MKPEGCEDALHDGIKKLLHSDCPPLRTYGGWIRYLGKGFVVKQPFRYKTNKIANGEYICCVDDESLIPAPICMSGETAKGALEGLKQYIKDTYVVLWGLPKSSLGVCPMSQKRFLETVIDDAYN